MSKRFGRNQKRQLRESLQKEQEILDYTLKRLRTEETRAQDLKTEMVEWAGRIARFTAETSPFRRAVAIMGVTTREWEALKSGDPMHIRELKRERLLPLDEYPPLTTAAGRLIEAYAIYCQVEERPWDNAVLISARTPLESFHLLMDKRTFLLEARHVTVKQHIAHKITKAIDDYVREYEA